MKKIIKFLSILLVFCILLSVTPVSAGADIIPYEANGTVTADLNMRAEPSVNGERITVLSEGSSVDIYGYTYNSDGEKWFAVRAGDDEGFSSALYINDSPVLTKDYSAFSDKKFEELLVDFPESYKDSLRALHSSHPKWKFIAFDTGLSWDKVAKQQQVPGMSLIQSPDAWKSFEKGTYDWKNKSWNEFDSGGWVQCCNEVVNYYLDPRNYLTEKGIFAFMILSYNGKEAPLDDLESIFEPTFMHNRTYTYNGKTYTWAQTLNIAAKEKGVNPYLLAIRLRLEQGIYGNALALGFSYGGKTYYNPFDIGAYAYGGKSAIQNGGEYASKKGWDSPYTAIMAGAEFLAKSYIAVGQDTFYLQKFDVVDGGNGYFGHQYMTAIYANESESITMKNVLERTTAMDSELIFSIPVYDGMPKNKCEIPSKTGSADNTLVNITVDGKTVSGFDRYEQKYEIITSAKSITVDAVASDKTSEIKGCGTVKLSAGDNVIKINVKSTNGNVRIYTLTVKSSATAETKAPADKNAVSPDRPFIDLQSNEPPPSPETDAD